MEQKDRYIRFDWAVKRLLRNKANFGVLEGFLTVLLASLSASSRYWKARATSSVKTKSLTVWTSRHAIARMKSSS